MLKVQEGQCGACRHFGESHADDRQVVQIHSLLEAPEEYTDECGHPRLAPLHLQVTAVSGCDGFEPAAAE